MGEQNGLLVFDANSGGCGEFPSHGKEYRPILPTSLEQISEEILSFSPACGDGGLKSESLVLQKDIIHRDYRFCNAEGGWLVDKAVPVQKRVVLLVRC